MKRLLAALLLLPALAFGAANDLFMNQRDPTNQTTLNRTLTVPAADAIVGYTWKAGNATAREPMVFTIGAGLQLNGQVLSAPGVPGAAPSWESVTGKPAVFPPAAHVHSATDVTTGVLALARLPALPISQVTGLQTALDSKLSTPAGTAAQYVRGAVCARRRQSRWVPSPCPSRYHRHVCIVDRRTFDVRTGGAHSGLEHDHLDTDDTCRLRDHGCGDSGRGDDSSGREVQHTGRDNRPVPQG